MSIFFHGSHKVPESNFHWHDFSLHRFTPDAWHLLPPTDYRPRAGDEPLGDRLPVNWSEHYRLRYKQHFEPVVFYRNAISLTNLAAHNPDLAPACAALFSELVKALKAHSVVEDKRRYLVYDFDLPRYSAIIPAGWSSSLANAFALAGLTIARRHLDRPGYATIANQLAHAFEHPHRHGSTTPERWISYVDEDGHLWFEEYPLPDGRASRVLNGHIHSVLALALHHARTDSREARILVNAGLTTLKANVARFRRKGKINLYDLLNYRPDYAPNRTVRQQFQLFTLTRDEFFRTMAYSFHRDFVEAKHPELLPIELAERGRR